MAKALKTQAIVEQSVQRQQRAPELAKQAKARRVGRADGGVRAVEHTVHSSRTQQVAEDKEVIRAPKRRWQRAAALPAMPELPGFHIEWVRRDNQRGGHGGDHANMIAHLSEGWELCRKSDFPKHALPTHRLSDQGEVIGNDSSILMKIDDDLFAQRNAFYNSRRNKATDAVNRPDQGLTEASHPAMPLVEDVNRSERRLHKLRRKRRADGEDVVAGEGHPD